MARGSFGGVSVSQQTPNIGSMSAAIPLNVTVLVPCVGPKVVPAIVAAVPTAPDDGVRLVSLCGGAL
jgi:hypothetical protein